VLCLHRAARPISIICSTPIAGFYQVVCSVRLLTLNGHLVVSSVQGWPFLNPFHSISEIVEYTMIQTSIDANNLAEVVDIHALFPPVNVRDLYLVLNTLVMNSTAWNISAVDS